MERIAGMLVAYTKGTPNQSPMDHAPEETVTPPSEAPVTPPPADAPVAGEAAKGAAYGSVISIILIVALLMIGAFYVWNERLETSTDMQNGVRGEVLPDGSMPSVEGAADVEAGPNGPMPQ